jgi:predicted dehydrogenase
MTRQLRAGVAGGGVFGGYHARKYASLDGVSLRAVFDPDEARAHALADQLGATAYADYGAFLNEIDVLTVASPATTHAGLAKTALAAGRHVYVEKPLAVTRTDGHALIAAAAHADRVLSCGHQERVVFGAMGLLDAGEQPLRLQAVRRGTYSGRAMDVSCVLDLMVHDLDLALMLTRSHPIEVRATGQRVHGELFDEVSTQITFEDGLVVELEASRAAARRERTMRVVYPSGELQIDFLERTFSNATDLALNADFADTPEGRDPLGANVSAFLAAVRGEALQPLVTGEEAARALDLALRVEEAAGQSL